MLEILKYDTESLVKDIKKGGIASEKAIGHLIKENEGKILAYIRGKSGTTEDGEDIFQEAIAALILNIRKGNFKGESSVNTYLFAICKGMWYKRFRKIIRDKEYRSGLMVVEMDEETPDFFLMDSEQKVLLGKLFELLKAKCKETLYFWASGFSMTEIAEKLEFSNSQVAMNKKNKCLKELKDLIRTDSYVKQLITDLS